MEELLHQHYFSMRVSQLIVEPAEVPTNAQTTELIDKCFAFAKLYRLPQALFRSQQWQQKWDEIATGAETVLEGYRRDQQSDSRGMVIARRENLMKHLFAEYNARRPFTILLQIGPHSKPADSTGHVFSMVSFVYRKMLHASRGIEHASALVFVGHRDWATLNRWERINEKRGVAQILNGEGLFTIASTSGASLQSLGHHVPSFPVLPRARRGRRSRAVWQSELEGRWA
ncbi:hypothetical protein BCR35DRAFT_332728 [Leucosporidium creatinivorum]|uniref:Uncharacterized protein n=1 Tax=Leucosporidium creatinivorum TaxID=106004 RepID=A0A1Y2EZ87_9BASI|nr:hypothetical protein BCR35DRAFT_332728 [Leucosporidium creatinivorum]